MSNAKFGRRPPTNSPEEPNAVRLALERAREAAGEPPPVALVLPEHVARRDAPVRAHDLASYDRAENDDGNDGDDDSDD